MRERLRPIVERFLDEVIAVVEQEMHLRARQAIFAQENGAAHLVDGGHAISPKRQLHGRYMGRLHALKGNDRQRVVDAARKQGKVAALELADKLLARRPAAAGAPKRRSGRFQRALDDAARREINLALLQTAGGVEDAARLLGMTRRGLSERLHNLGIQASAFRGAGG